MGGKSLWFEISTNNVHFLPSSKEAISAANHGVERCDYEPVDGPPLC